MNSILEMLKYTLPSLIVLATAWIVLWYFFRNNESQRKTELALKNHEILLPLRLQAYERIALLLERLSVDSMLVRLNKPGLTVRQLQSEILATIRGEFEHNLSQQIYMSTSTWDAVRNARNQLIKIINSAAESIDPTLPSIELAKKIIENLSEIPKLPTMQAAETIKAEVQELF
jgi:hypothetical protein